MRDLETLSAYRILTRRTVRELNSEGYVLEHKKSKNVPIICKQLYDLAMLAHKPLNPEEMTAFVKRSNEIMMLLTK